MAHKIINRRQASVYLKGLKSAGKTPVSLAMELATRLGVVAEFHETKDIKWTISSFKYIVTLGDLKAVGVAGSKKEAKQNAAKELIKLIENESETTDTSSPPGTPNYQRQDERYSSFSSPSPSLSSSRSDSPCDRNYIGELGELAAKKKWPLPEYEYGDPTGEPHSRTFTCLVKMMSDLQCTGVGSSKKAAKKEAAEKMLGLLKVDGDDFDMVDARTPMWQPSRHNVANSSSDFLTDSDLEGYDNSDSESPLPVKKMDLSTEMADDSNYDELAEHKLMSCSGKDGYAVEYIPLPNKSFKGLYQVFVKLTFTDKQKHPIVTHGSGETLGIARCKGAERALKHLELMLSVQ